MIRYQARSELEMRCLFPVLPHHPERGLMSVLSLTCRFLAVGKRGKPTIRANVIKDKESIERRRQHARDAKARNATDMDRHVRQAYKVCYIRMIYTTRPAFKTFAFRS